MGTGGPLTAAEQVAILDRQLEESTRDFDGIIYDEEQRQREAARERAAQTAQTAGSAVDPTESEEPDFGGGMASAGSGSVGGGIGGRSGAPPTDGASIHPRLISPTATTMMSWLANFARQRCGSPTRLFAKSCGQNIASTKALRSLTHDPRAALSHLCGTAHGLCVGNRQVDFRAGTRRPATLTPEAELLDVGVVILDPGISAVEDEEQVYPEVRKAEATFMATELAEVLTEQGGWGAVRSCPTIDNFLICWCAARSCAQMAKRWN